MHSCTQGIAFLLHFFKCHHLPDLRILAVEQEEVWCFLRLALRHEIKEPFQGIPIFEHILGLGVDLRPHFLTLLFL